LADKKAVYIICVGLLLIGTHFLFVRNYNDNLIKEMVIVSGKYNDLNSFYIRSKKHKKTIEQEKEQYINEIAQLNSQVLKIPLSQYLPFNDNISYYQDRIFTNVLIEKKSSFYYLLYLFLTVAILNYKRILNKMGLIRFYLFKDNPAKLLELYKKSGNQDENLKICNRLIELNALDQLLQIKDHYPTKIYPHIINAFSTDSKELFELYSLSPSNYQSQIVDLLIANKANEELLQIKDYFPLKVYPYLINIYCKDNNKLIELYKTANQSHKAQIADMLIVNKSNDYLWHIKSVYSDKIYPYLIELYKNDNSKLLELYRTANQAHKAQIVDCLIANKAINELYRIIDDFPDKVYPFLIRFYNNESYKLKELFKTVKPYAKPVFQEQIVDCLLANAATGELWDIKNEYTVKIYPYLLKVYSKDNGKLIELYRSVKSTCTFSKEIIDILISNYANVELWQIKDDYPDAIYPFLIDFYSKNNDKIMELYHAVKSTCRCKKEIVDVLLSNNATSELWLIKYDYPATIYPYLINVYKNDNSKLLELYKIANLTASKDKIIELLIANKANTELEDLAKSCKDKKIMQFLFDQNKTNPQKIYSFFGIDKDLDKQIVNKLITLKADEFLTELTNTEHKLTIFNYLQSKGGLDNKIVFDYIKVEIIDKIEVKSASQTYLKLIEILSETTDAVNLNSLFNSVYEQIFNYGIANKNNISLVICNLLNPDKYLKSFQELKSKYKIIDDLEAHIDKIKTKYSNWIASANTKDDVNNLLSQQQKEIETLLEKEKIILAETISKFMSAKPTVVKPATGYGCRSVNLIELGMGMKIVANKQQEENSIKEILKKEIYNLTDANEIMKVKDRTSKQIEKLVGKESFIYTVINLTQSEIDHDNMIELLGNILLTNNDIEIKKAILYGCAISKKLKWLVFIHKVAWQKELELEVLNAIFNKLSSWNLIWLFKHFKNEATEITLFNHLYHLLFNASDNDIETLIKAKNEITFLPKGIHESTKNIITNLIEKAGRKSKSPTLATEVNVKSKEIEIIDN